MNIYIKNIIKFFTMAGGLAALVIFAVSVSAQQASPADVCTFNEGNYNRWWIDDPSGNTITNCFASLSAACQAAGGRLSADACVGARFSIQARPTEAFLNEQANLCTMPPRNMVWVRGSLNRCVSSESTACGLVGGRFEASTGRCYADRGRCSQAGGGYNADLGTCTLPMQTQPTQPTAQPGTSPRPTASVTEAQRLAQARNIAARSFNSLFRFPITAVADAINQPVGGVVMAQVPANIGGITEIVEVALEKGDNNRLCAYLPDGAEIDSARPQGVSSASGAPTALGQLLDIFRSTRAPALQFDRNFPNSICITNVARASALTARFGIKFAAEVQGQAVAAVTGAPVPPSGATPPRPTTPAATPAAPTTGAAQPRPSQAAQPTPSVPTTGVTPSGKLPAQPSAQPAAPSAVCPPNLQAIVNRAVNETCRKGAACISRARAALEAQLKRDRRYTNCDVYPYFTEAQQSTAAVACPTVDEASLFSRIDAKCKKGSACTRAEFTFFAQQYPSCGFSAETFMQRWQARQQTTTAIACPMIAPPTCEPGNEAACQAEIDRLAKRYPNCGFERSVPSSAPAAKQ